MDDWKKKLQGFKTGNNTPVSPITCSKDRPGDQKQPQKPPANPGYGGGRQQQGRDRWPRQDKRGGYPERRRNSVNNGAHLFHNPYHFVPVPSGDSVDSCKRAEFEGGAIPHLTHDRYPKKEGSYSGRIICRMETKTPIFIGGKHEDGSRTIPPFEITSGVPAIPASTLRGLISSMAEAVSNSALRVLEDRPFSRRMEMREALKAIGIMEKDGKTNRLMLRPLVMPSLRCDVTGGNARLGEYAGIFTKPALRVYLDGYRRKPGSNPPERQKADFLASKNPKSYSADNKEFWYMQLGTSSLGSGTNPVVTCSNPRIKTIPGRNGKPDTHFLNGQSPNVTIGTQDVIIDQATYDKLDPDPAVRKAFTKGILRFLGLGAGDCRAKDIPEGKKHEIFIPYDPASPPAMLLDVTEALERFHELAKTRTDIDPSSPFELEGSRRNPSGSGEIHLREGDLVFFDIQAGSKVKELAISSIWRKWIDGSCHEFFKKISPELLPFNPSRRIITIAEQMFGFVEERKSEMEDKKKEEKASLAFKSRVRFSNGIIDGVPEDGCYLPEEDTLKILDSPKPPSPSMYFTRKDREGNAVYIPKFPKDGTALTCSTDRPKGRKMYLHHKDATANKPWKTAPGQEDIHADQKSKIKPIRDGLSFYFHIDFDNLTKNELSLLCYALVPNKDFMHKIGMGKPIGLGSVKIHPEGIFFINRERRYSAAGFEKDRYHNAWTNGNHGNWPQDRYDIEKESASSGGIQPIEQWAAEFPVAPEIGKAIELLGSVPEKEVHYPRVQGGDAEEKLFQWFVANDIGSGEWPNNMHAQKKFLEPITERFTELPSLKRYLWKG
jgi:CRISPR-associated protein (TIGR03986 family)